MIIPILFIACSIAAGCAFGFGLVAVLDRLCAWQESRQRNG
jgi:hypothetical protein